MPDRRAEIRSGARGQVVEVSSSTVDRLHDTRAGTADTVIGIDVAVAGAARDVYLEAVEQALAPDGWFGFVEPDHDFPASIRAVGLFVTDLWRVGRVEVAGWARRPTPPRSSLS